VGGERSPVADLSVAAAAAAISGEHNRARYKDETFVSSAVTPE
jgi:hypothetical protein